MNHIRLYASVSKVKFDVYLIKINNNGIYGKWCNSMHVLYLFNCILWFMNLNRAMVLECKGAHCIMNGQIFITRAGVVS